MGTSDSFVRANLRDASVARGTNKQYRNGVAAFIRWAAAEGEVCHTVDEFDECMADYIQQMYDDRLGVGRSLARNAVQGATYLLPELKGRLPKSWQALRGWEKMVEHVSYLPLRWHVRWQITCITLLTSGVIPSAWCSRLIACCV